MTELGVLALPLRLMDLGFEPVIATRVVAAARAAEDLDGERRPQCSLDAA
jgi:hypothetical protein